MNVTVLLCESQNGNSVEVFANDKLADEALVEDQGQVSAGYGISQEDWESMDEGEKYSRTGCFWTLFNAQVKGILEENK